jgi:cytochrome b
VWDLPLRLFHWGLLAAVTVAIVTGEVGGNWMNLHGLAGLAVVGLLAFRGVWGLVGSPTARFAQFFPTPGKVVAYLRGQWHGLGHNPLGAFSVFGLLGLLALQVGTGLFGNDEIAFTGPLNSLVEEELGLTLTGWHRQLVLLLFVLLALHISAIVFYRVVKKHNLVKPMLTGWTDATPAEAASLPPAGAGALAGGGPVALALALAVGFGAVWVASGGPWRKAPVAAPAAADAFGGSALPTQAAPAEAGAAPAAETAGPAAKPVAPASATPSW